MKSKKLTKAGGLTIPSDMRRDMNLMAGDAVDVDCQDGALVITAHLDRCFVCQSEEGQKVKYMGKVFCQDCIGALGGLISG